MSDEPGALRDRLWSHAETAAFLDVSEATLHQWLWKGTGPPSYKVGRHRKYRPAGVEEWLEARADHPRPAA